MNTKAMILYSALLLNSHITYAEEVGTKNSAGMLSHVGLSILGSYMDFKFDSTEGANFSRFNGNSKLIAVGAGNIQLAPTWYSGVSLFRAETNVGSQIFLSPGAPAISQQSTRNNTLFGHILKQVRSDFYLDLAGAYGQNKVNIQSTIMPNTNREHIGYASTSNNNWFTSFTGIYSKAWNNFLLTANGRVLYSQINSGSYSFLFQSNFPTQTVQPLTNKVWFLIENVEVGYNFDKLKMPVTPFVNGGLLQVLNYTNSRPIVGAVINGTSPQLNMNKDGFRVGGGLSFRHKSFTVRIEEQYYNASGTYSSYQTLAGMKYTV